MTWKLKFSRPHRFFELREYDPDWPEQYEKLAERVKRILGNEIVEIHHIGSTSIPGMLAKPQIDILVLVRNFDKIPEFYPAMEADGFTPHGTKYLGIGDEYFTEDQADGRRLSSVHVFPLGDPSRARYLNFRNYMRTHPEDRDLYSRTKKEAYEKYANEYSEYVRHKDSVIQEIRKRADAWAAATSVIG